MCAEKQKLYMCEICGLEEQVSVTWLRVQQVMLSPPEPVKELLLSHAEHRTVKPSSS